MAAYRKMTCPECSKVLRPAKPVPAGNDGRLAEPVEDGKLRWELFRSRVKRALAR